MAFQGNAPLAPSGTALNPVVWNPGQPAPTGYKLSADGQSLVNASTGAPVITKPAINGTTVDQNNPAGGGGVLGPAGNVLLSPATATGGGLIDLSQGNVSRLPGDVAYGFSGGTVGNNAGPTTGSVITPNAISDAGTAIGKDVNAAGGDIAAGAKAVGNAIGNAVDGGSAPSNDTKADHDRAMSLADTLSNQANTAGATAAGDRGQTDQTRAQQESSIQGLTDAANGAVPSAAEIQGRNQAAIDSARQYGLAAALQGNNPAAALRQASLGAAAVNGTNNANATALRATEQANARNALASTLGNVRSADTGQQTTDIGQQTSLNNASATQSGQGVTSTGQQVVQDTNKYNADQVLKGAIAGGTATLLGGILKPGSDPTSDKRAKKDIKKAGLADELGKGVTGVSFSYKPGIEDDAPHFGVLADELEKVIPGVVKPGPMGLKVVDAGHMTMANTGILAELAKRIMELEKGKRK